MTHTHTPDFYYYIVDSSGLAINAVLQFMAFSVNSKYIIRLINGIKLSLMAIMAFMSQASLEQQSKTFNCTEEMPRRITSSGVPCTLDCQSGAKIIETNNMDAKT